MIRKRRNRSTANTRRISSLRSSLPRRTGGAAAGRAAAVLPAGHERAAAQAPPGRSARRRSHQPVPQPRFVRRVRHVALAGTAEQAPVHILRIARRATRCSGHDADRASGPGPLDAAGGLGMLEDGALTPR